MSRKLTLAEAKANGAYARNPKRYQNNQPTDESPLGDCPDYIVDTAECKAKTAWKLLEIEGNYRLTFAHRALVEMCALVRGELIAGGQPGIHRLNFMRQCLNSMGMTPLTAGKVPQAPADDEKSGESNADEFFDYNPMD